jgi:GTPase SAR1 family protein
LQRLDLDGNPLNPELAAADKGGIEAVKRHLRALAEGGRKRYEAKLLILGDGNEGKTCVSRALRGLPFEEPKPTHGMDVGQWTFAHPDDPADRAKDITLNIWDFEGREISHQTHQFFLTSQSLYLLVFKCRDQFQMDRAEYWLDTIRARAPRAKVVLVISQCEERTPRVPLDRLHAQFGDLLAREWFFPVGCENGLNVEKLRACLQRSAADLDFMGAPWPASYALAEPAVQPGAKTLTLHSRRTSSLRSLPKQGSARTTSIMPPRSPVWG